MLRSTDVLALEPRAQLEHLATNRRVGFFVTMIAGGVRLALLAGALLAHAGLTLTGAIPFGWWSPLLWLGLSGVLAWAGLAWIRRSKALSARLPTYEELGRPS